MPDDEYVEEARFVDGTDGGMFLRFKDGLSGEWSFEKFDLYVDYMNCETIRAENGVVVVEHVDGDLVGLDGMALRWAVDDEYAKRMEAKLFKDL